MRHKVLMLALTLAGLLASTGPLWARGLLIPEDKALPPLAMLNHKVTVTLEDQVAVTRVEQTFRNHTDRQLEATYVFPVPKGASVNRFTMWVGDKEVKGELVEAKKAAAIYTAIVRRTQDPALLEYLGNNLLRLRVFPVPARGDQKVSLSFTAVADKDGKLVEYVYPLKTDGKAVATLEKFSVEAVVKSQHGLLNVYSPTHALTLKRISDKEVRVSFDKDQGLLDRDFRLFYAAGKDDVGLTALTHRPVADDKGFFTLLISPKSSMAATRPARDLVLVLDTSGSMRGARIEQARKALNYCLKNLTPRDRFGLIGFATTVNPYEDKLLFATPDQLARAKKWVDDLEATGGTAIDDALEAALKMRPASEDRPFTITFFTDGEPTIGETDPEKILKNALARNTANTRIFTFGVGDEVNAALLDRLADKTRALSAYVRPTEDVEAKVSSLFGKIANPVLTNLKLTTTGSVRLSDTYPAALPDLFHNGQLVVMGRFEGKGAAAIKLTGKVGKETREFVYELRFPEKTADGREFVEHLWARRKVGYLLDQVRINGEKKELVDEITTLAKRYGITTPYTSHLIVPDASVPSTGPRPRPRPILFRGGKGEPAALAPKAGGWAVPDVEKLARQINAAPGGLAKNRSAFQGKQLEALKADGKLDTDQRKQLLMYYEQRDTYARTYSAYKGNRLGEAQVGRWGVNNALQNDCLRTQTTLSQTAQQCVNGRNVMEVGGIWIDEGFGAKTKAVAVKAQSDAYFRILERHPTVRKVYQLGNHVVWMTPSGSALVVDTRAGNERMTDAEIDALFVAKR